jgi:transposase
MRHSITVELTLEDRTKMQAWSRSRTLPAKQVQRSRILLEAAGGLQDIDIAQKHNCTRQLCSRLRSSYLKRGLDAVRKDAPRPGRPRRIDPAKIVSLTTTQKPDNANDWSRSLMAKASGASASTVGRVWKNNGLKPHRVTTFKISRDPKFYEKLDDIVGLYLSPPCKALVLCLDEKSQIQALDRTQPGLPLRTGRSRTQTHDYKRNGTTTLFAAMNVLDGTVISMCQKRHRHQEWLKFLKQVDRETPAKLDLHVILDNYSTHKHVKVKAWLAKHPRFHLHFTPTSSSWLNMVERFFRDLTTRKVRDGIFKSVQELEAAISDFIAKHNAKPKPFIWTAKAKDILAKVVRAKAALDKLQN